MINNISKKSKNEILRKAMDVFYNYLNLTDQPTKADVIFILGGSSLLPVEKAKELYEQGFAPKIAFISVGGKFGGEKTWGMPENQKYKEVLLEAGIPKDAIVTAGLTTNTLIEAQQAIPFMKDNGVHTERIILVSRPIHQRRAYATFVQQHSDIDYLNCPANEPLDFEDTETQERLVQEAERLLDYSKKGDIQKQEIPRDILKAAVTIRLELKEQSLYTSRVKS